VAHRSHPIAPGSSRENHELLNEKDVYVLAHPVREIASEWQCPPKLGSAPLKLHPALETSSKMTEAQKVYEFNVKVCL
jgi:hypothetical protein